MYGGFDVYKTYLAIKLHFQSDSYDYYKYGGKVNAKLETFTRRKDRYFFYKLGTKYGQDDILDFFVANFIADSKRWIGNLLQNAITLLMILASVGFLLMMALLYLWDNTQECYVYLFKGKLVTRPRSCLITFLTLLKIGIKKLPRKLYGLKSHLRLPE
jgi:hypothetical protein